MAAPMRKHVLGKFSQSLFGLPVQRRLNAVVVRPLASKATSGTASKSRDPGPEFIRPEVQSILHRVTGINQDKVFRTRLTEHVHPPKYKLLTDEQIRKLEDRTDKKTKDRLQMPPVLKAREDVGEVLSNDSEIDGYETHNIVFTDITTTVSHKKRVMVVREPNGILRHAKPSERDRLLQIYYPRPGQMTYTPTFLKPQELEVVLQKGKYEYILDVACVQFEPDDPEFIRVTQRTYEHIASNSAFEALRSTRYFGCMAFSMAWYNNMEPLLADMLDRDRLGDAQDMMQLYCLLHPDSKTAKNVTPDMPLRKALDVFLKNNARNPPPLKEAIKRMDEKSAQESKAKASAR